MGKTTGFLEYTREVPLRRDPAERIKDWFEIYLPFPEESTRVQAARCMDCGVPFCHTGCPLTNVIPDWNDMVYHGRWREAIRQLHATNNFPEFTGRICPAPCEASCVLGISEPAVTIKQIEKTIVDRGFEEGFIKPEPPSLDRFISRSRNCSRSALLAIAQKSRCPRFGRQSRQESDRCAAQ
jgi:glutamate synthase (NADPH/NADH) small chain